MPSVLRSAWDPDVPVLLIVAPGDSETVEQAAELGISHFAEEPITPKVLALAPQAALPDDRPRDGRPRPVWEVIAEEL